VNCEKYNRDISITDNSEDESEVGYGVCRSKLERITSIRYSIIEIW